MSAALILALALAQTQAAAATPDWQSLGTHERIETFFDPASVQPAGARRVRVRIRGIIAAPGADGIKTATGLLEIDCAQGTATAIEVRGTDAEGALVLNALVPPIDRRPEPIRPASPNAAVRDAVCASAGG
ncbi:MAG TPA: surface-adhesin E family protein [Allosphingosinicella sp.]|nr:surface-adhesin E family protein [Allosphingosinicella sp.]